MADQVAMMWAVVQDRDEETVLQDLAHRAGLRWVCECGYWNVDPLRCDGCGVEYTESAKSVLPKERGLLSKIMLLGRH